MTAAPVDDDLVSSTLKNLTRYESQKMPLSSIYMKIFVHPHWHHHQHRRAPGPAAEAAAVIMGRVVAAVALCGRRLCAGPATEVRRAAATEAAATRASARTATLLTQPNPVGSGRGLSHALDTPYHAPD